MKNYYKAIIKWLNKNKVLFEIAASISVIFIAFQANTISKAQVENNELINQPNFKIEKLPNDNLMVNSDTFKYSNLELATATRLKFSYTTKNSEKEAYSLHLPEDLIVFDNFRFINNPNLSNEIEINLVKENDSLFFASKASLEAYFEKKHNRNVEIGIYIWETFLELKYFDFRGNEQIIYFNITENPRRAPEWKAKPVFNDEYNLIYLDRMGYEFLDDIFDPKIFYDVHGNRIYFTDGLEHYYDKEGNKIKLNDSIS